MRADIVHITDHALLRWRERAAVHANEGVEKILESVKESRVLKRKEPLPYPMPRLPNSVYSVNGDILFVMESVTISEYRLVTVITHQLCNIIVPKYKKVDVRQQIVAEKMRIQEQLSKIPKFGLELDKKAYRKQLVITCAELDQKLVSFKNKPAKKSHVGSGSLWRPTIILSDVEKALVNEILLDVANKLGLVEDFCQSVNLSA